MSPRAASADGSREVSPMRSSRSLRFRSSSHALRDSGQPSARRPLYANEDADAVLERNRRRSEEHTSELQSQSNLVCRLLLEKKKKTNNYLDICSIRLSQL